MIESKFRQYEDRAKFQINAYNGKQTNIDMLQKCLVLAYALKRIEIDFWNDFDFLTDAHTLPLLFFVCGQTEQTR